MTTVPTLRLAEKVAIITGASSGIGRAIALLYASHGTRLIVCADLQPEPQLGIDVKDTPTHELICQRYGKDRAIYQRADVGNGVDVEACVAAALKLGGGRLDM